MNAKITELVRFIYEERGEEALNLILPLIEAARSKLRPPENSTADFPLDEGDSILITYGDQFREEAPGCQGEQASAPTSRPPLSVLKSFLDSYLLGTVRGVHILPFSP
ncbi:MAG: hypothetical protein LBT68_05095 [Spirochaetales bacterium]|jgi:sucrose phosphorylase|nr:hypothetical protein [Spirochaetales bacterium]